jgi:peptidoglycan hydrolase CwlO-like protein
MDVNDSKFIKMYNELKSNFEDFSLYVNNTVNDIKTDINDVNNNINDVNNNINDVNNNINAINKNINAINKNINEKSNIMENKVVIVQLHNSNNQEYDRIYLDPNASYFINVVTSRGNIFSSVSKINTIFIQDSENDKYDNVSIDFYSKETSGAFRDMKLSVYFELSKSVEGYNYMIRMIIEYLNTDTNK